MRKAISLLAFMALSVSACSPIHNVKCDEDLSDVDLFRTAITSVMNRVESSGQCQIYESVENFFASNPDCCSISRDITIDDKYSGERTPKSRWMGGGLVTVRYLCRAQPTYMVQAEVDVDRCNRAIDYTEFRLVVRR